jgi:hypothetical protein
MVGQIRPVRVVAAEANSLAGVSDDFIVNPG